MIAELVDQIHHDHQQIVKGRGYALGWVITKSDYHGARNTKDS
jgi:hypothetical protein